MFPPPRAAGRAAPPPQGLALDSQHSQQQWGHNQSNAATPQTAEYLNYGAPVAPTQQSYWQNQNQNLSQQNVYNQNYNQNYQQVQTQPPPPQFNPQYQNPNPQPPQNLNAQSIDAYYQRLNSPYQAPQIQHAQNYPPNTNVNQAVEQEANETDPWNWGWDENAAAAANSKHPGNFNTNANVLGDSFTNTEDAWTFSVKENSSNNTNPRSVSRDGSLQNIGNENNAELARRKSNSIPPQQNNDAMESVQLVKNAHLEKEKLNVNRPSGAGLSDSNNKSSNDKNMFVENSPNIAKTFIGNISHQWSTESQPSQESSDGLLSHTESTTGSEDPSKNSDKNSPILNSNKATHISYAVHVVDNAFDNFNQQQPNENVNRELANSVQNLNINSNNIENLTADNRTINNHQQVPSFSPDSPLSAPIINSPNVIPPPSRMINSSSAGGLIQSQPVGLPPSGPIPNSHGGSAGNPFKRTGQLSHRPVAGTATQIVQPPGNPQMPLPNQQHIPDLPFQQNAINRQPSPMLQSQNVDHNAGPGRIVHANLETTPDNSERPDNPSPVNYRPMQYPAPPHLPVVENCEVAPSNDRNEYLQTGHLSDAGFNDNTNFVDTSRNNMNSTGNYPPPGFHRMVLGQPESEFRQNPNFGIDEPPPGLSRMVPGSIYNQPNNDYLDRQIDGQTTESESLTNSACMERNSVYRQVDGQPTDDEIIYNQSSSRNSIDRRPLGFDRMVPGEASNSNFNQTFQNQNFNGANEERVVTGFEQVSSSEPREQNMDGSDYSEVDTSQMRNVIGATDQISDNSQSALGQTQSSALETDLQRGQNMEGENLQDLSVISPSEFSRIRDQNMDGADTQEEQPSLNVDPVDSESDRLINPKQTIPSQQMTSSDKDRKYRDDTTGDESERDKIYKMNASRKEKEGTRLRSSRERDYRYNDRRDERKSEKDRRGVEYHRSERERLSEDKKYRRIKDSKYDTEDTDYYSDKERRKRREGSYTSAKPPRPEDRSTRKEEDGRRSKDRYGRDDSDRRRKDDRDRRYDNYESERDTIGSRRRDREIDRDFDDRDDRGHRRYGNSDRERYYASMRREKGSRDDRRKDVRDPRYVPLKSDVDAPDDATYDPEMERDHHRDRRPRDDREGDRDRRSNRYGRDRDRGYNYQYYEGYGYSMDPYSKQMYHQQQTYQYYEKLRLTNPQAYLEIYNKYMSGAGHLGQDPNRNISGYGEGYSSMPGYDALNASRLGDERGSVHSGRSSANGEGAKDRMVLDTSGSYYYPYRRSDIPSASYMKQDTPTRYRGDHGSIRTDYSGSRDFNTDASLNLYMDNSTVKSERYTPVKFATAHIKGVISSPNAVIINPSYPSDGQPALVEILNINKVLSNDPVCSELAAYPGPLIKGTTHKKTVIEFCESKIRNAMERFASPLMNSQDRGIYAHQPYHSSVTNHSNHSDRNAPTELASTVLMWKLLILLLRQNGMVVGTDIAELLVKNKFQFAWKGALHSQVKGHSRRDSASSATSRSADMPLEDVPSQPQSHDATGNQDIDHDSSNDVSVDQSQSLTGKRERKQSKDNSFASKPGRKTSSNLNLDSSQQIQNNEKYVTDKFREYLLFGSGKDALEWAMSNGLWGHALFLASKLDRRTYANVMARFANGLLPNDPLQTLYQLMSGRQPASVTCVLDEKWGDWRPHLAMILSNTSQKPDLDKKSITVLGDTLLARGDLYAAQFCYLMARVEFGKRPCKNQANTPVPRLVLLGSSPTNENFAQFASNESIMMTEIYEYACSLADNSFVLVDFQVYKYLLATRLIDYGFYDRALFYMERISQVISLSPGRYDITFIERVLQIADRLKHYDPEQNVGEIVDSENNDYDGLVQQNSPKSPNNYAEQAWISGLRQIVNDINIGNITLPSTPQLTQTATNNYDQSQNQFHNQYDQNQSWTQQQNYSLSFNQLQFQQQLQNETQNQTYGQDQQQQLDHGSQLPPQNADGSYENSNVEKVDQPPLYDPNFSQNNSPYYTQGNVPYSEHDSLGVIQDGQKEDVVDYRTGHSLDSGYWNQDSNAQQSPRYNYSEPDPVNGNSDPDPTENGAGDMMEQPRPQISMPNSMPVNQNRSMYDNDNENGGGGVTQGKPSATQNKDKPKKDDGSNKTQASSGWFGGIFNKLSLKPKNQMILPDDKNPSIVWDPEKKKWTNLDADGDEQEAQFAPPPKISDLARSGINLSNQNQMPSMGTPPFPQSSDNSNALPPNNANMPNIYKLQKGRHIKKSYVDVFNPSGAPMKPLPPASEVLGAPQLMTSHPSYFVPNQSADGINNNTQTGPSFYNPSDYPSS